MYSVFVSCIYLYSLEDSGAEDVHPGVDLVGDKDLWFLHESLNLAAGWVVHHHSILTWLLHLSHLLTHVCVCITHTCYISLYFPFLPLFLYRTRAV